MKTFKEYITEAKSQNITDYDEWKAAVKKAEPKSKITKEGHGGSEMLIASVPGSAQMVGKWFGDYGKIYK